MVTTSIKNTKKEHELELGLTVLCRSNAGGSHFYGHTTRFRSDALLSRDFQQMFGQMVFITYSEKETQSQHSEKG